MLKRTAALAGVAAGLIAGGASAAGMQQFQWQNRPLVVFAPAADSAPLQRQRRIAAEHAAGFAERDMVVISVVADAPVGVDGAPAKDLSNAALRARFEVPPEAFAAILVGKDGGAKLRRDAPLDAATLFSTIDAMPMRRREMREDGEG